MPLSAALKEALANANLRHSAAVLALPLEQLAGGGCLRARLILKSSRSIAQYRLHACTCGPHSSYTLQRSASSPNLRRLMCERSMLPFTSHSHAAPALRRVTARWSCMSR